MYPTNTLTAQAMEKFAWSFMQPLYGACSTSPHSDVNRRLHKFTEELGEVAGCYNDLWGSGRKGLTSADLMEEKIDLFVVSTDTIVQHNALTGGETAEVACQDMAIELYDLATKSATYGLTTGAHGQLLQDVAICLGKAISDVRSASTGVQRMSLANLHTATARLLLAPEPGSNPVLEEAMVERLPKLLALVELKLDKWIKNRVLPQAA